jgi:hypothetical protein
MRRWIVSLGLLMVVSSYTAHALDMKGLVLYLTFDEGSGTAAKDASGKGNNGTLSGKVDWVAGKRGKAIQVNDDAGGNLVTVKNNASLNPTTAMTITAWANVMSVPDGHVSLVTKADTWMIHVSNWRGTAGSLDWEPLFWTPAFVAWQTKASAVVKMNEWHHIAGVYDGANVITYIDGKEAGRVAQKGPIATSTVDVVIGRDSRGCCSARKAKQAIDDVTIWDRGLSAAEVVEVMDGKATAVEPQGKAATLWGTVKASI